MALIEPDDVDWSEETDLEVMLAAEAGLDAARTEAHRRGLIPTPEAG